MGNYVGDDAVAWLGDDGIHCANQVLVIALCIRQHEQVGVLCF